MLAVPDLVCAAVAVADAQPSLDRTGTAVAGRLSEQYALGELIAQAASGLVYRGQDLRSAAAVVIQRLKQHLLSESPEALAEAAPRLAVLVTSRQSLGLQAETLFRLEGLELPAAETSPERTPEEHSAIRLFVQGARRAPHDFEVQPEDWHLLRRICEQVQGMPLAIVLAASWAGMLSLAAMVAALDVGCALAEPTPGAQARCRRLTGRALTLGGLLLRRERTACAGQCSVAACARAAGRAVASRACAGAHHGRL